MQVSASGARDAVKKPYGYSAKCSTSASGLTILQKVFAAQVGDENPTGSAITDSFTQGDLDTIVYGSTSSTAQYQAARMTLQNAAKQTRTINFRSLDLSVLNAAGDAIDTTKTKLTDIRDAIRTDTGDNTWKITSAEFL